MTDQISQSDIDEYIFDLATTHPEFTPEQFKNDFKAVIKREPKFAEIKTFQKAVLNCKGLKGGDAISCSPNASSSINPLPGIGSQVINGYKLENKIGDGSFGEVWKVWKDGRVYALKITKVFKDDDFEVMFASSLKLTCKFLVRYHDAFVYGGKNFCVMDYCPQGDLRGLLKKQNKQKAEMLPIQRIMKILIQLYLGLYELHGKYIVHRDIKLENIFINDNDDIQLGDFGLGRMLDDTEGKASTTLGTPAYMAPELFVDNPSYGAKVDIWALGVTAYQLCTLELPFKGNKYELAAIIKKGKYTVISRNAYPVAVCEMIESMLQLIPDMRPSALDLLQLPLVQEFATELQLLEAFPSQARTKKSSAKTASASPFLSVIASASARESLPAAAAAAEGVLYSPHSTLPPPVSAPGLSPASALVAVAALPQQPNTPVKKTETSTKTEANAAETQTTTTYPPTPTPSQQEKSTAGQAATANFSIAQPASAIRAPVVNTPGCVFRVECRDGRYGYGKKNTDCERLCCKTSRVVLYSSERGENTISINKNDIIGMQFITCTITRIGDCFLSDCASLTTPPTIPNTVTSINGYFLSYCSSLTTPPTIPNTVTSIGERFLSFCTSLTTPPTIPNTVTSINGYFLSYCTSLTTPPTIPNTVTSIDGYFLSYCKSLTTPPTIPNTVTSINGYFLSYCTSLTTSPTIPNTVTSISEFFLSFCTSLTTPPTIPNTVTSIGKAFLYNCTSLTKPPTIPNTVTNISSYFLSHCTSLTTPPTIPNTVTSIGCDFLSYCTSLTTPPTIPNTVMSIGEGFLSFCTSLTTPPTIPNTVTSISGYFLSFCKSLTTPPTIPNTVTSIGEGFMSFCTSLTTPPTIPNTVTRISSLFFLSGCTLLEKKKTK